jgi:general secretion pathway protein G
MAIVAGEVRSRNVRALRGSPGFTLLELMIVIAIIIILATLGVGRYQQSLLRAREAALHQDLFVMRNAIQQYTEDKGQPPSSLDDLQTAGYIGSIPVDPITHQQDWATEPCDELFSADQSSSEGICDVHAGTDQVSPIDNEAYSSY